MSWWGKVIGGTLGYMLGGPLGALLGMAVGHSFDERGPALDWSGATRGDTQRLQLAFFTSTFTVMGHLCKVDGRVSEDEIRTARAVMDHMRLDEDQRKAAIRLFEEGKQDSFPLDDVLQQFRQEAGRQRNLVRMFVEIQVQAALADGVISEAERGVLGTICRALGVSPLELAHIEALVRAQQAGRARGPRARAAGADLGEAYRVLGIDRSASDAEVKKAYRRLMNQHHPDKLVSRGLPEEMVDLAQEKSAEIRKAYDTIKASRGMK